MDGVFMKKLLIFTLIFGVIGLLIFGSSLISDKETLQDGVLRLHVIANSDSEEDQQQKLLVRDSIVTYLQPKLEGFTDKKQVMAMLEQELPKLKQLAQQTLEQVGSKLAVGVSLCREAFDTRDYETFSLPAGIYDALKIEIGEAEGKNWWCVVFPSLCLPAAGQSFVQTAAVSGIDRGLSNTLTGNGVYEIRFFFLDCLGKLENYLK